MIELMGHIFTRVLLPVLAMAGLGALAQRRLDLNLQTLVRLNLYLFVPAFLFVRVSDSELTWSEIGGVALCVILPMAALGLPIYTLMRRRRAEGQAIAAAVVGGLFFNAGNFGIPVAELAFGEAGGQVQALVVMVMNTSIFFIGYGILALGQGRGGWAMLGYFKLPMIYAIAAGFLVRETGLAPPGWLDEALRTIAAGMVPVALITLGAQLVARARWPRWRLILPVVSVKLMAMPVVTAALVWALGLWPWPGAQLILAAAGPTAVNTLLLTVELDGDADTAADCVFWTTLLCAVSVTIVLTLLQLAGGGPAT